MTQPPPEPKSILEFSREDIWEAILEDQITDELAAVMLADLADGDIANELVWEFVWATTDIGKRKLPEEKAVLFLLAGGGSQVDLAETRWEAIVQRGGAETVDKLRLKGGLFAAARPRAAIDAYARLVALAPNDLPAHDLLARLSVKGGDQAEAEKWLRALLKFDEVAKERRAATQQELASIALEKGRIGESDEWSTKALKLYEQLGDTDAMVGSLFTLGRVAYKRGDFKTAESQYRRMLALQEKRADKAGAATTLRLMAETADKGGDPASAEKHYKSALKLIEKIGNDAVEVRITMSLAILAGKRDDARSVETYWRRSLSLYEKLGDKKGAANTLTFLADLVAFRGDHKTAVTQYDRARLLFGEVDEKDGLARAFAGLARCSLALNEPDLAVQRYTLAVDLYNELGDQERSAEIFTELGNLASKAGDIDEARHNWGKALVRYSNVGKRNSPQGEALMKALDKSQPR